jgi:hypothetical protein
VISKGFSGHGVANRDAPFDALFEATQAGRERLETWNRDEQHLLRRFDTRRVNGGVAGAQHPHRVQLDNGGSENPRVMIADRLLIIRHVPCHRDLLLRPVRQPRISFDQRNLSIA